MLDVNEEEGLLCNKPMPLLWLCSLFGLFAAINIGGCDENTAPTIVCCLRLVDDVGSLLSRLLLLFLLLLLLIIIAVSFFM